MGEIEDGTKLINEAMEEALEKGWTNELKEKFVLGVGMENNGQFGDATIIQHFFIGQEDHDAWFEYAEETWEDYINEEFEDNFNKEYWEEFKCKNQQ